MKTCPTEFEEQALVVQWARTMASTTEPRLALLHGDSSGVRVSIGCAMKMKRAGAVKGFPDLFLPIPLESYPGLYHCCGLFIELKRRHGGVVRQEQIKINALLRAQGYAVNVCRGADEAIECIREYLSMTH